MNNNKEIIFFEQGLALVIANLEYAEELLIALNYKNIEKLTGIIDELSNVEDLNEYKNLVSKLAEIKEEILSDQELKNNNELFILLNEPVYLNKHIEVLLNANDNSNIEEHDLNEYLKTNFSATIGKILDIEGIDKIFNKEAIEILKILVKESKFKDMVEGLGIIFAFATNTFEEIKGVEEQIYNLLAEADALASFIFFVNQDEEEK